MELFGITKGILVQQVNCQNQMYAGLAKAIYEQYPQVKEDYTKSFEERTGKQLYGTYRLIDIDDNLKVANLYTQYDYADPSKPETMGKVYTDRYSLVQAIKELAVANLDRIIYVPFNIGCGLGGEVWEDIVEKIDECNLANIQILNTMSKVSSPIDLAHYISIQNFFTNINEEKRGQFFIVSQHNDEDNIGIEVFNSNMTFHISVCYNTDTHTIWVIYKYEFSEKNSDQMVKATQSIIEYKSIILQMTSRLSDFLSEPEISELKLFLLNAK